MASTGGLLVDAVRIAEPRFGILKSGGSTGPIAFRTMVPWVYSLNPEAPVTLRLFVFKSPDSETAGLPPILNKWNNAGDQLSLSIVGKRLRAAGSAIEPFGGGLVNVVSGIPAGEMRVIDLPLESLGCDSLSAGDFLAFEMDTVGSDAVYRLLGVELFSSDTADLANATVVTAD